MILHNWFSAFARITATSRTLLDLTFTNKPDYKITNTLHFIKYYKDYQIKI